MTKFYKYLHIISIIFIMIVSSAGVAISCFQHNQIAVSIYLVILLLTSLDLAVIKIYDLIFKVHVSSIISSEASHNLQLSNEVLIDRIDKLEAQISQLRVEVLNK